MILCMLVLGHQWPGAVALRLYVATSCRVYVWVMELEDR